MKENKPKPSDQTQQITAINSPMESHPHKIRTLRERLKEKREEERKALGLLPYSQDVFTKIGAPTSNASTGQTEALPPEEIFKARFEEVLSKLLPSLTERQKSLMQLIDEGKNNDEISENLHLSRKHIERLLTELRKRAEIDFLKPAGFNRAKSYGATVLDAVLYKRVTATTFMRMYYTTDQAVDTYKKTRKGVISKSMEQKGIIPLHKSVSQSVYYMLKNNPDFSHCIISVNNVDCIAKSDFDRFLLSITPTQDEQPLTAFTTNEQEQRRLRSAIYDKRIKTKKKRGQHFVTKDEIESYERSVSERNNSRTKNQSGK